MQELLKKVKMDLRIKHDALDEDIQDQIKACLLDLQVTAGIDVTNEEDPLLIKAIKLYCRANYKVEQSRVYQSRYDALKACLQMASGYGRAKDE